ncbi:hypothetical protein [Micromonospora sp. NPDC023633]|uniref:hypothetical protein n=1 Tax=Micromonospora sp. NPDC023633 TaxID=3154320 RepID=UPI003410015F
MDLLAKAGVAEPPRTWREVTVACQAIRKMAGGPTHGHHPAELLLALPAGGRAAGRVDRRPRQRPVRPAGDDQPGLERDDGLRRVVAGLHRDGALAFMQHLNSPRNVADWAKHHYRIPITRAAVDVLDQEAGSVAIRTCAWPATSSKRQTAHPRRSYR